MKPVNVLSLGAGVQSSCLLLMSIKGIIPKPDLAIFADTQWEPAEVYSHLDWLEEQAKRKGIPCIRVSQGNLREDFCKGVKGEARFASLPLFVKNQNHTGGRLMRQCTADYKIKPIERYLKSEVLGLKKGQRTPKEVMIRIWMGISLDEVSRAKPPMIKKAGNVIPCRWKEHVYPLLRLELSPDGGRKDCGMLPEEKQRRDCVDWLSQNFPNRKVPRSACIGCPFHSDVEWREMKEKRPQEWKEACQFDRLIRKIPLLSGKLFLHRKLIPLAKVDLRTGIEKLNGDPWMEECEGMCGI